MDVKKIIASIMIVLAITISYGAWADQEGGPPVFEGNFAASAEWVEVSWQDWKFDLPANWASMEESGWGIIDLENKMGVAFKIMVDPKHVRDMPPDEEVVLEELGGTWAGNVPATGFLATSPPNSELRIKSKVVCLDEPREDGSYLIFTGVTVGLAWEDHQATIERIFASIAKTGGR